VSAPEPGVRIWVTEIGDPPVGGGVLHSLHLPMPAPEPLPEPDLEVDL
jgi:hypothetical protein